MTNRLQFSKFDGMLDHDSLTRFEFFDDFFKVNDEDWIISGDATIAFIQSNDAGFQKGGWLELPTSAATDNHEAYVTTGAWYKCEDRKTFCFSTRFAMTEAATNAGNFLFGFINAGAADLMVDNGAGPIVAADKALFYKVDGTMQFNAITAKTTGTGTNVQTSTNLLTFVSGTIYELDIVYIPDRYDTNVGVFKYFINRTLYASHAVTSGTATSTTTAMPTAKLTPVFGVKNGTAAVQNLHLDYLGVYADR